MAQSRVVPPLPKERVVAMPFGIDARPEFELRRYWLMTVPSGVRTTPQPPLRSLRSPFSNEP